MTNDSSATNQGSEAVKDTAGEKAHCRDCGLAYGSAGWADFVVPDHVWATLTHPDDAAILCANCMVRRANLLGLDNIEGAFTSGPFIRHNWRKPETMAAEHIRSGRSDLPTMADRLLGEPFNVFWKAWASNLREPCLDDLAECLAFYTRPKVRPKKPPRRKLPREDVIAMYAAGHSLASCAEHFCCNWRSIQMIIKRHAPHLMRQQGVRYHSPAAPLTPPDPVSNADEVKE